MPAKLTKDKVMQIVSMIKEGGRTIEEIADATGVSKCSVSKWRDKVKKGNPMDAYLTTEEWLQKYWKWTGNVKGTKSKYRVVHKGEKGNLRTPYRPDRRFW